MFRKLLDSCFPRRLCRRGIHEFNPIHVFFMYKHWKALEIGFISSTDSPDTVSMSEVEVSVCHRCDEEVDWTTLKVISDCPTDEYQFPAWKKNLVRKKGFVFLTKSEVFRTMKFTEKES